VVGVASVVVGAYHLRVWRTDSLSAANAAAVIAGHFTFLAFGFACKEISIGGPRSKKLVSHDPATISESLTFDSNLVLKLFSLNF
jgi:hypothetical protein